MVKQLKELPDAVLFQFREADDHHAVFRVVRHQVGTGLIDIETVDMTGARLRSYPNVSGLSQVEQVVIKTLGDLNDGDTFWFRDHRFPCIRQERTQDDVWYVPVAGGIPQDMHASTPVLVSVAS